MDSRLKYALGQVDDHVARYRQQLEVANRNGSKAQLSKAKAQPRKLGRYIAKLVVQELPASAGPLAIQQWVAAHGQGTYIGQI